jgi:hypothetical protein
MGLHVTAVLHVFYHKAGNLHGMITLFVDLASMFSCIMNMSKTSSQSPPKPMRTLFLMPGRMSHCVYSQSLLAEIWEIIGTSLADDFIFHCV